MIKTKLTILTEDTALSPCRAEHGFSALVERGGRQLLFDCGATGLFLENAAALGLALKPDAVVLSHNHYDHAGDLPALLRTEAGFRLYLSAHFEKTCYWIDALTGAREQTESAVTPALLRRYGVQPANVSGPLTPVEEMPGVWLLSDFERVDFEPADTSNFADYGGGTAVDDYRDELALAIESDDGLTVLTGCAHNGPATICEAAARRLGRRVVRYFGGTHLIACDAARIARTAEYLAARELRCLGACHCTGEAGFAALEQLSGFRRMAAGNQAVF